MSRRYWTPENKLTDVDRGGGRHRSGGHRAFLRCSEQAFGGHGPENELYEASEAMRKLTVERRKSEAGVAEGFWHVQGRLELQSFRR